MLTKIKKVSFENAIFYTCVIVAFIFILVLIHSCYYQSLSGDEIFSLETINGSYGYLFEVTENDVHPPLYYVILKFGVDLIRSIFPFLKLVVVARFVSLLGLIILFYFMYYKFPKYFPKVAVGLTMISIFVLSLSTISTQIRMYSWLMLFAFITFYYTTKIIKSDQTKSNIINYVMFAVFFECCAYTHNYGLIFASGIYLYLFIYTCIHDRKHLKHMIICGVACAVLFLPWLVVLLKQMTSIHNSYWIEEGSWFSIFRNSKKVLVLVIVGFIVFILLNLFNKKISTQEKWVSKIGLFSALFTFFFTLIYSLLFDSIMIERYFAFLYGLIFLSIFHNIYLFLNYRIKEWIEKLKQNRLSESEKKSKLNFLGLINYSIFHNLIFSLMAVFCAICAFASVVNYNITQKYYYTNGYEICKSLRQEYEGYTFIINALNVSLAYNFMFDEDNYETINTECYTILEKYLNLITYDDLVARAESGEKFVFISEEEEFDYDVFEGKNVTVTTLDETICITTTIKMNIYVIKSN